MYIIPENYEFHFPLPPKTISFSQRSGLSTILAACVQSSARGCGARYVHPCWERHHAPHTLLTPEWLARVRGAGLGIVCWHEERPAVLEALLRLGVSAICTDRLDLIAEAAARLV